MTRGEPAAAPPGRRPPAVEVIEGDLTAVTRPGEEGRAAPAPPPAGAVEMTDAAVREVVRGHTCEAGVRELARQLGAVGRFVACLRVEKGDAAPVTVVADEAARLEPSALSRERARVTGLQPADPAAVAAAAWIEVVEELPWRRGRGTARRAGGVARVVAGGTPHRLSSGFSSLFRWRLLSSPRTRSCRPLDTDVDRLEGN